MEIDLNGEFIRSINLNVCKLMLIFESSYKTSFIIQY